MRHLALFLFMSACAAAAGAQPAEAQAGKILVTGTVANDASKASVLAKLREVYGADMVVDQISVGGVVMPANWDGYVQKLITPELKEITRGHLKIDGSTVNLKGEVKNEATRQKIASNIATSLNSTYSVSNGLRVTAQGPDIFEPVLKNRIVEFESGKATLTPAGQRLLDEIIALTKLKLQGRKIEIIGHTDNQGLKASNQNLSHARAEAVKLYMADKGINPDLMTASGQGADRPVADNSSADGRARNRRIEFRLAQ